MPSTINMVNYSDVVISEEILQAIIYEINGIIYYLATFVLIHTDTYKFTKITLQMIENTTENCNQSQCRYCFAVFNEAVNCL